MSSPVRVGHIDRVSDLLQQIGVLPRDHVFQPRHVVFLQRFAQPDAGVHADVAEVVRRQRHVHADDLAHLPDVVGHQGDTLLRQFDAGEHMLRVERRRDRSAPVGCVTVPGTSSSRSMPRSIFSQVKP